MPRILPVFPPVSVGIGETLGLFGGLPQVLYAPVLISPSVRNEFHSVEPEKRCEIIDVGDLSDHRAIIARLRIVQPIVVVETDEGTIEIELYPDVAPKTVANFVTLVEQGFYDGLTFHRYVENFVIQGGDPNADGTGGPGWTIEGEFQNPKLRAKMPRHEKYESEKVGKRAGEKMSVFSSPLPPCAPAPR